MRSFSRFLGLGLVVFPLFLAACSSSDRILDVRPKAHVSDPLGPSRSIALYVDVKDERPDLGITYRGEDAANREPYVSVPGVDQALRDAVIDGMRQHGFRIASSKENATRVLVLDLIESSIENVTNSDTGSSSSVIAMLVRADSENDRVLLSKTYSYMHRLVSVYEPGDSAVEKMVDKVASTMVDAIINDTEILEILNS